MIPAPGRNNSRTNASCSSQSDKDVKAKSAQFSRKRPAVPQAMGRVHKKIVRQTFIKGEATRTVCWFVGCLTSQQHASVSQGRICSDKFTCCHTEIKVADQTFHLTQSRYTDTGPTSPSTDPITPGARQGSHWSSNFEVTGMTRPGKIPSQPRFELGIFRSRGGHLNN